MCYHGFMTNTTDPTDVKIDCSEYRSTHGRNPRGRGGWLFAPPNWRDNDWGSLIETTGTFQDAADDAKYIAAERGFRTLSVCP